MRVLLYALLALFVGATAAAFYFDDCNGNTTGELYSITGYNLVCIAIAPADALTSTPRFHIGAKSALVCFDPALDNEGADDGEAQIRHCPNGRLPAANPEYQCDIDSETLTGLGGDRDTTTPKRCKELDFGSYQVEMTSTIGAGHVGRITIQGLGD
jgi:hypothetical protein